MAGALVVHKLTLFWTGLTWIALIILLHTVTVRALLLLLITRYLYCSNGLHTSAAARKSRMAGALVMGKPSLFLGGG